MSAPFSLALAQMRIVPGASEANLRHAQELVAQAADAGAHVVLLPEALPFGWTHPSARAEAGPIPEGAACLALRETARRHRVYLCSGLVERAGDKLYNAAVLIDPRGELLLHHRKIHELDIAQDLYARGDRLHVVPTPLGTFGLMICADAFAPGQVISRTLGLMGAHVILSPCAWAVPAGHDHRQAPYGQLWRDNYCPVARDFRLWIAGASNVGPLTAGPWQGRRCIGCSLVVDPAGHPVLQGPYGPDAEALLHVPVRIAG